MQALQMFLFEDNSEIGVLKQDQSDLRKSINNLRKGLFSRFHNLEKMVCELKEENEKLQSKIQEMNSESKKVNL